MRLRTLAATLAALALGTFAAQATAEVTVGLHGPSTHMRQSGSCADGAARTGPNNQNYGAFVRWNSWELGDYHNSACRNTLYAGYVFEAPFSVLGLRPAIMPALATGYKKSVSLAGTVSVSFRVPLMPPAVRGRVEYTHDPRKDTPGVLHTRLEYTF